SAHPGSVDRMLMTVDDIEAARADFLSHGVEIEMVHDAGGGLGAGFHTGTDGRAPGPDPQRRSYASYASFSDPDRNLWILQEIKERDLGRVAPRTLNGKMTDIVLQALKETAAAHGVHEKELGKPDPNWPEWYADHMARTLAGAGHYLTEA